MRRSVAIVIGLMAALTAAFGPVRAAVLADEKPYFLVASPEMGEASETIDVEFVGDEFSIGFNASYVQQVLSVIPEGTDAVLGVSDEVSPGVITTPSDSQFTYVVMPMRL